MIPFISCTCPWMRKVSGSKGFNKKADASEENLLRGRKLKLDIQIFISVTSRSRAMDSGSRTTDPIGWVRAVTLVWRRAGSISNISISGPVGASAQNDCRLSSSDYEQKARGCEKGRNFHEGRRVGRLESWMRGKPLVA